MSTAHQNDNEQATLWNGVAGRAWVEAQDLTDRMLKPLEDLLVGTIPAGSGGRVLDVGCGTGSTTVAVAQRLGSKGQCTGVDISEPMLSAARQRAQREKLQASFILADAQTYTFEPASYDLIVSRFGVMFFDDPVQAFANLRRAASEGGALRFIAWRTPAENPFMTTAQRAAAPLFPELDAPKPDGPGQFAFGERSRIETILKNSGWAGIDIESIDVPCSFPERDLAGFLTRLGPVGRILQDADESTRARVFAAVRPAFNPYIGGDEVRFSAACWMVSAQSPARN